MAAASRPDAHLDVHLVVVDDAVLDALVDSAVTDAAAEEVTPPASDDGSWNDGRVAWLRAFHRDRRGGVDGPLGEATWAVTVAGQVVGSVRLKRTASQGVFEVGAWLSRAARGHGVGRVALAKLMAGAARLGATTIRAETAMSNAAALAVLRHLGFHLDQRPDGSIRAVLSTLSHTFPSPTLPMSSRAAVFLGYLDYFRSRIITKVEQLGEPDRRSSRLPSGWTPLELVKHLTFVELRWLEWGWAGRSVEDPWADDRDGRWYVSPDETTDQLISKLRAQAVRSRALIESNDLSITGQPGPRWNGADPATLERVLFHLLQEYARHLGHLDVVVELAGGSIGE